MLLFPRCRPGVHPDGGRSVRLLAVIDRMSAKAFAGGMTDDP